MPDAPSPDAVSSDTKLDDLVANAASLADYIHNGYRPGDEGWQQIERYLRDLVAAVHALRLAHTQAESLAESAVAIRRASTVEHTATTEALRVGLAAHASVIERYRTGFHPVRGSDGVWRWCVTTRLDSSKTTDAAPAEAALLEQLGAVVAPEAGETGE